MTVLRSAVSPRDEWFRSSLAQHDAALQNRVFPDRGHFDMMFFEQCKMSADGIPQLSAVFGGCTAGSAYIPALSDEVVMVRGRARIRLGGPIIVKAAINEDVDGETLGGADMHTRVSGVFDCIAEAETDALARLRQIVAGLNGRRSAAAPRPARASWPQCRAWPPPWRSRRATAWRPARPR